MDTIRLEFGAMMASDWDKTRPNIRMPRDELEEDFGSTVVGYRFQEDEAPRQTNPTPQQPPQKQGSGIPGWVWGLLAGFGGFIFLVIAGVLLYLILRPDPGFTLVIEGAPANSRIFISANERCVSAERGTYKCSDIRAGKRNIRITADGYVDYNATVDGENGEEVKHIVSMTKSSNGSGTPTPTPRSSPSGGGNDIDEMGRRIERELQDIGRTSIYGINFDFNSDKIKPESIPILNKIAEVLNKHPEWIITVEGHTDNKGGVDYNLKLSDRRAKAVKDFLSGAGVPATRLTAVGFGFGRPIASNDTEEGQAKNRRVELVRDKK